jgi:hypothetical protein
MGRKRGQFAKGSMPRRCERAIAHALSTGALDDLLMRPASKTYKRHPSSITTGIGIATEKVYWTRAGRASPGGGILMAGRFARR